MQSCIKGCISIAIGDLQAPHVTVCATPWVPSESVQILLCTCGYHIDMHFYLFGEVCLVNGVCIVIIYSLFLRETMNLALYFLMLESSACLIL